MYFSTGLVLGEVVGPFWKLTAGSKESSHRGGGPLTLRILPGPDWKNSDVFDAMHFVYGGSWNFHVFLVSLYQSTAWVSFSIFDCVDKTHPVGSVVLCRSSMLQLEYFTRPLDVLHRSWTMLMLDKKTIAVCPFAATLILSRKPCNSSHEARTVSSPAILDVAFASDIFTHLAA